MTTKLKKILLISATICMLSVVFFLSVYVLPQFLTKYHPNLEQWASRVLEHPVQLKRMKFSWHDFSPVLQLEDVIVWDDKRSHAVLKVDHLGIRFSLLNSLLQWRAIPNRLFIAGTNITVRNDPEKGWTIDGMRGLFPANPDDKQAWMNLEEWLLYEKDVVLENVRLNYQTQQSLWITKLSLKYNSGKKQAVLQGNDLHFNFGKLFREEIPVQKLSGILSWEKNKDKEGVTIFAKQFDMRNADLNITGFGEWHFPTGQINLKTDFNLTNVPKKGQYFPVSAFNPKLTRWLDRGIVNGKELKGTLILKGDLTRFPFDDNSGQFIVDAMVSDFTLDYEEGWPAIQNLDAKLLFSGRRMDIEATKGKIFSVPIQRLVARIPDLGSDTPQLTISGAVLTDGVTALNLIQHSPLEKKLGKEFEDIRLQGPMNLSLDLNIPLNTPKPNEVAGKIILENNILHDIVWDMKISQLAGEVLFTENTLTAKNLKGLLLKQPIVMDIVQPKKSDVTQISIKGQIKITDLSKYKEFDIFKKITSGSINYQANLNIANYHSKKTSDLTFVSDLKGLRVDLPAPFGKTTSQRKNLRVQVQLDRDFSQIKYGDSINIQLLNSAKDIRIQSPTIEGRLQLPATSRQPWNATFSRLHLPSLSEKDHNNLQFKPEELPAFNLNIRDFRYNEKSWGNLALKVTPLNNGIRINSIVIQSPTFNVAAQGTWQSIRKNVSRTQLMGEVKSTNIAGMFKTFGVPAGVTGKSANINFNVAWLGVPYEFDLEEMVGSVNLLFKKGTIKDRSPNMTHQMNFGRLLNLLSIQTLQRRFSLDFSDLSNAGFSFDILQGQFKLNEGNAVTQNLRLEGPIANIGIKGRIGLENEDYDLWLQVAPHLTASLPAIATIQGGPIVGAAVWLGEKVLGPAIREIATQSYRMQGSWEKPIISPLKK